MPVASPHSRCLPSYPFLPFFSMPLPFLFPSFPVPSFSLPTVPSLPSPQKYPPSLLRLWVLGSAEAPPVGQTVFGELQATIAPVVAMVLRMFTSIWLIAKKRNTLPWTSITTGHLLCYGTQKFQCWLERGHRRVKDTKFVDPPRPPIATVLCNN